LTKNIFYILYKYIIYLGYCEADLIEVCACCIEKLGLNIWSKNFVKREYVNSRIGKGERWYSESRDYLIYNIFKEEKS